MEFYVNYNFKLLERKKKGIFSRLAGLFSQNKPLTSNMVERYADNEFSAEYTALDLSKNDAGIYELEVELSFPESKEKYSRKIKFELL